MTRSELNFFEDDLYTLKTAMEHKGATEEIRRRLGYLVNMNLDGLNLKLRKMSQYRDKREEIISHPALLLFLEISDQLNLSYEMRSSILTIFAQNYLSYRNTGDLDECIIKVEQELNLRSSDIAQILLSEYDKGYHQRS